MAAWYKGINPYFYNAATWESDLFTETVKATGNWWCLAALLAALVWAYFLWKAPMPPMPKLVLKKQSVGAYILLALAGIFVSLIANHHTIYASDEVFSAVNFASLPAFQCFSNYPKPNNHLLFNGINGALFFWCDDLVLTGRLISLFCYFGVLAFTWHFLGKWTASVELSKREKINEANISCKSSITSPDLGSGQIHHSSFIIHHLLKCLILLVVALQFPVWGFSWQARGYEMVLLCSCLSLGSFMAYFTSRSQHLLPLHIACNMAGMLTLPTYLYWWLGLLLAFVLLQVTERRLDKPYIRSSIMGFAGSLLLYLPLLSFSGLAALADNKYVQSEKTTTWHFLTHLNEHHYFDGLFSEWFCAESSSLIISAVGLLLPVLLFIYPRKNAQRRMLGIVYYSILIAFLCVSVFILKLPFYRNMIAHGYWALLVLVIAIMPCFRSRTMQVVLGIALLVVSAVFAKKNHARLPNSLYYYDVAKAFETNSRIDIKINPTRTIYLDYESFYWWYVLQKKYPAQKLKIETNRPRSSQQESHIMQQDSVAHTDAGVYQLTD